MAEHSPLQTSKSREAGQFSARYLPCAVALLALISLWPQLPAQGRPSQYDVEAAYLLDFGKFTQLSAGSQALRHATFDICIVGRDPIGPSIDRLAANDTVDGHAVRVLHGIDASQARTCAIALIGTHTSDAIRQDLEMLSNADVLTVGDSPEFLNDGGMIQFVMQQNHVRFAVNLNAVRKAHLVLSSELLRVALYVQGEPKPGVRP